MGFDIIEINLVLVNYVHGFCQPKLTLSSKKNKQTRVTAPCYFRCMRDTCCPRSWGNHHGGDGGEEGPRVHYL